MLALLVALLLPRLAATVLKFKYKSGLVHGDPSVVDELLEDMEPWIEFDDASSTEWISLEHRFTKSRVLLTEPCRNDPISLAATFANASALEKLLESGRFESTCFGCFALKAACTAGHLECALILLKRLRDEEMVHVGKALGSAAFMGHLDIVKLLLNFRRCDPHKDYKPALLYACRAGHLEIARLLLENLKGVDVDLTEELLEASRKHHGEVVFELFRDGRSDLTASNFLALRYAIKSNNLDLVRTLIDFGPADSWMDDLLYRIAIKKDHVEILEFLLEYYKPDTEAIQKLFGIACSMGSYHCTMLLLRDPAIPDEPVPGHTTSIEVDFSNQLRIVRVTTNHLIKALFNAASNEHEFIIRALIKDGRFDDGIPDIIYEAFLFGRYRIGRLLLAHPAVSTFWLDRNPTFLDQGMLIKACKLNETDCINNVLVPITMDDLEMLLRCSISHGHISSFTAYLSVLFSRFEEISGERAAEWLETLDYCAMFIIRDGNTGLAIAILKLLGVPLGYFLEHETQERDLLNAIKHFETESLSNLQRLFELYLRHLALMVIMDEKGLKDLWHQIITYQLKALFDETYLKFKVL